tara:strand:- start:2237 stop:2491 length:255 start_codon:yes stop_codon:yes gene_type:complete
MHKDKVTPTDDLSWWIKWAGTIMFLCALIARAADISVALDIALSFNGAICWLVVGWMWHDRALIILNAVASVLLIIAFINQAGV